MKTLTKPVTGAGKTTGKILIAKCEHCGRVKPVFHSVKFRTRTINICSNCY